MFSYMLMTDNFVMEIFGGLFFLKIWATEQNSVTSLTTTNYWKNQCEPFAFQQCGLILHEYLNWVLRIDCLSRDAFLLKDLQSRCTWSNLMWLLFKADTI